jgi:alpha-tubulin suppressor-like RCC1 family protein
VKQVIREPTAITSVALLADGTVYAWGQQPLGNGGSGFSVTPVKVTTLSGVTAIAAMQSNALSPSQQTFYALRNDGTVWAWGYGRHGELGDGSTTNSPVPVQVSGLTGVTHIVTGDDTAYAVRRDHTVWAWGVGTSGQLGNGGTVNSDVPVQVKLPDRAAQVDSRCGSAYALVYGQRVFAWGDNTEGQLGDGTRTGAATPVLVRRVNGAAAVVAGCVDAYAIIHGSGTVMAWGEGDQGEMGDGHTATRTLPVQVSGLTGVTKVSVGYATTYAVGSAGMAWAWGYGRQGQLGDGIMANSSVPVKLINITVPVTAIVSETYNASGQDTVVARGSDGSLWSWGDCSFGDGGHGGCGPNPGRIPRIPPVTTVFGRWFGAV